MAIKEVNGTTLYYETKGEGIPTVILHGWGVDHQMMSGCLEPVFEQTASSFYRIYIDLPGRGRSIPGDDIRDSHDILRVIYALLDEIIPGQAFLVIGESHGGYLARAIVKERMEQVLGLIFLCPAVYPGFRTGKVVPLQVMEKDEAFLSTLSEEDKASFTYMNVRLTKGVWERFKEQVESGIRLQNTYFLNNVLKGEFTYDVDDLPKPYTGPALFITGKQDTEVGYEDQFTLQKSYINGTYIAIACSGHNTQIEQPEIFSGVTKGWLDAYF